jgi:hypothetical protein
LAGDEYLPAPHASQLVFRPNRLDDVPSAHSWQSTSDVLEQAMQPGNVLYLPTEQRMQGPPVGPQRPAMHEQFSLSNASAGLYVPSLHWACTPP